MEKGQNNIYHKMSINWYPGHMAKTMKQIAEDIKLVDIVIEILDARIPISSQNPQVHKTIQNKKKIIILNKQDLADEKENQKWVNYFNKEGASAILCNASTGEGINKIVPEIEKMTRIENEKMAQKGRIGKITRVMIIGIPNVGKSSIINKISKKNSMKVANRPGVTVQKQWIRLSNNIGQFNTIIQTSSFGATDLRPGDETTKTLILSQLITPENTEDDLQYTNMVEIVKTSNTNGRRMAYSVVGNQDPLLDDASEVDSSTAERIVILTPFGENNFFYIIAGIVALILVAGIVIIKVKVLNKRN